MLFNYNCKKKKKLAIKSITGLLAILEFQGVQFFLGISFHMWNINLSNVESDSRLPAAYHSKMNSLECVKHTLRTVTGACMNGKCNNWDQYVPSYNTTLHIQLISLKNAKDTSVFSLTATRKNSGSLL